MIVFNGEFISAETGEDEAIHCTSLGQVYNLVRKMKDGDSLVINASEES